VSYQLVAQGTTLDANEIAIYGDYLEEGQRGMLQLDLRWPVLQSVANGLEDALIEAGVEEAKVTNTSSALKIEFRQGFPWLAVIAAIVLGVIVIAILIIGWRFFREVVSTLPPATLGLAVIALIVLGVLAISRRRVSSAGLV